VKLKDRLRDIKTDCCYCLHGLLHRYEVGDLAQEPAIHPRGPVNGVYGDSEAERRERHCQRRENRELVVVGNERTDRASVDGAPKRASNSPSSL
jgi:hypothetical protein